MPDYRLGDIIDDHCIKCRRVTNHAIVSLVNAEPAKVRCRTCYHDHDYRHEQAPPPKTDPRKAALFNEVLKKVNPEATALPVDDAGEPAEVLAEIGEAAVAGPGESDVASVPPPAPVAKPKPKGRARKG